MFNELTVAFVDLVPEHLEEGVLYVSEKYKTAVHLCACGTCGEQTVTPFDSSRGWLYTRSPDDKVTLHPSIGNFQMPCKSHYWIKDNRVEWC
jgi:Family of unknown function (DUF6527)